MHIHTAQFSGSSPSVEDCPKTQLPEYAFIGRSNVGKSSLINMLTQRKELAKTSGKPGKTRLINHFLINDNWYLADLPGYGYAKVAKKEKRKFKGIISDYILERPNLSNLFVLLDARHEPQKIDLEFMQWLGEEGVPFSRVFTKIDKLGGNNLNKNLARYNKVMKEQWDELPPQFASSATTRAGREELLGYIESVNASIEGLRPEK